MSVSMIQETFQTIDFRQHYQPQVGDMPMTNLEEGRHWLLDSVYGRDVLKTALRMSRPDLDVPAYKAAWHLDQELDEVIDRLGFRDLPKPKTMMDHARWLKFAYRMTVALETGAEAPPLPVASDQMH